VTSPRFDNRVTRLLGVDLPVVQAPMGWIARSPLASAVSAAGALGIIETSSGDLDAFAREVAAMRDLTDRPFGVNIAQNLVRDDSVIDVVVEAGVRFVTTSAGDPNRFTAQLKDAGLTVFHVVPTLRGALKAVDAGVDGLVVEGIEGGGFKTAEAASTMVLLPLIASKVDVPLIAAGGIVDGATMAAAFVLGAEGVQLGTRFVASVESPVHDNWKQAIVAAPETGTVLLNRFAKPGMRALRTERTSRLEQEAGNVWGQFGSPHDLYFGGDMEAAIPMSGQVAGRIDEVLPVATILDQLVAGFGDALGSAAEQYLAPAGTPTLLHHAMTPEGWARFQAEGVSHQSTRDLTLEEEGFIHCSHARQLETTLARYYADLPEVVVLTIDPARLSSEVREDEAANGDHYPHVYGPLELDAVVDVVVRTPT